MPRKSPKRKEKPGGEKVWRRKRSNIHIKPSAPCMVCSNVMHTHKTEWKLVMSKRFTFEIPSVCLYIHTHTTHHNTHTRACTHTHTHTHHNTCASTHTHIHTPHPYTKTHTTHTRAHTHTNTRTHTHNTPQHTHTHTQSRRRNWWGYQRILQKVIAKGLFKQLLFSAKFHLARVCLKWVPEYIFKRLFFFFFLTTVWKKQAAHLFVCQQFHSLSQC